MESWRNSAAGKSCAASSNEGVSGGETLIFDFTADQIVVDNEIALRVSYRAVAQVTAWAKPNFWEPCLLMERH